MKEKQRNEYWIMKNGKKVYSVHKERNEDRTPYEFDPNFNKDKYEISKYEEMKYNR